jgi:pantothenate kinase, type III
MNMVSLCFDVGNTLIKLAVFNNNGIIHFQTVSRDSLSAINQIIEEYAVESSIIASVSEIPQGLESALQQRLGQCLILSHTTRLPIENCYETKETLGKDRLAAVVGANHLHPGSDVLVIDAGTAITYDLITKNNQYLGGNISPGLQMRFKALNHFTNKLPLLEPDKHSVSYGRNTTEAIKAGVQNGMIFEIDGTIDSFNEQYPGLKVLFTGGDAKFFENKLKNTIFVVSNLVMIGLNRILAYNLQNH